MSQVTQNETFGAKLWDGTTINTQKIRGIKNPFMMRKYDKVPMNNTFSDYCVGLHIRIGKEKEPSDKSVLKHK